MFEFLNAVCAVPSLAGMNRDTRRFLLYTLMEVFGAANATSLNPSIEVDTARNMLEDYYQSRTSVGDLFA